MARTFTIRDASGTNSVSLINTGATGFIAARGGFGPVRISDLVSMQGRMAETYRLNLKASSHDNAASQMETLLKLLDEAAYHEGELWQPEPVYLQQQTTNESNARYARVYMAMELDYPDLFDNPFETDHDIENFSVTLIREHPWRSAAPGTKGTALTLAETDGPSSPTKVHIANFRDDVNITDFKEDDGGSYSDLGATDTLFPATVAQGDALLIGSTDQAIKHAVIPVLATAGDLTTTTLVLKYYDGSAFQEMTLGADYTLYPGADLEACFEQTDDDIVINVKPPSDWEKTTLDGSNAFWLKIEETNASPVYATNPVMHATETVYAQSTPYVEIPAAAIVGDKPPMIMERLFAPQGGDENPGFPSLSGVLIGAKSEHGNVTLANFVSHLNAGGDDNPAAISTTQGTDATSTADNEAPAGKHSAVDFATDSTMTSRVTFTLDDLLVDYEGEYLAIVRCQQIGGDPGDINLQLFTYLNTSDNYSPQSSTPSRATRGADEGIETLSMGMIRLPPSRAFYNDSLSATDIIFDIQAELTTGSATLRIYDLILLPYDEGSVGVMAPVLGSDYGDAALRGDNILDIDPGVIADRNMKYVKVGSNLIPSRAWRRQNRPIPFLNLDTKTRLYFVMMHDPLGKNWGDEPFVGTLGCHLAFEAYARYGYTMLRGSG